MNKDATNNQGKSNKGELNVPNFFELWKEMYFKAENTWSAGFLQLITTDSFVKFLDQTREQNLALEKMSRQSFDQYFEKSPVPSKKDVARVAELVISLEDKVDNIDFQYLNSLNVMADNLLKLAKSQEDMKNELKAVRTDLQTIIKKIDNFNRKEGSQNQESRSKREDDPGEDTPYEY